jgi:glyoxylase-like metal-dependent hydrolase (beta-lactamase superfamily II)
MKTETAFVDTLIDTGAEYRVTAVRYSQRQTSTDEAYFRNQVYGSGDRAFDMGYFFWIMQGPSGTFLFDTGFSAAAAERRSRTFLIEPMQALNELEISPESVDGLFLSHLHFDHTGHVGNFPNARVYLDRTEYDFWVNGYGRKRLFAASSETDDLAALTSMKERGQLILLDGTTQVLPGVVSIHLGGHTPGQHILSVNTPDGSVVLASDALHYYDEMNLDQPFALFSDVEGMYRGYEILREFEESGARVVAGHDMEVLDRFGYDEQLPFATFI